MSSATPRDGIYKQLFSHPQMVKALLHGFVDKDWVAHIDFATLEKTNGQYVSEKLAQRSEDVIWRVRLNLPDCQQEWLYLYLLIEFQSQSDRWMPPAHADLCFACCTRLGEEQAGQRGQGQAAARVPHRHLQRQTQVARIAGNCQPDRSPRQPCTLEPRFRHHVLDEG